MGSTADVSFWMNADTYGTVRLRTEAVHVFPSQKDRIAPNDSIIGKHYRT